MSSAIINVAQDVDEPWVLEVYGHDGMATNVTMEPGDMVLYESHSVIHGRPYPLKGRYYANIFIHFEPTGHSLRHNAKTEDNGDVHEKYRDATARGAGGHEVDQAGDLPSYIIPGTPEESNWRRRHPHGQRSKRNSFTTGSTPAHLAAQKGDLKSLSQAVENDKSIVNAKDENGWSPLHEASRGGHTDVVKFLHKHGADVNARTSEGAGTIASKHVFTEFSFCFLLSSHELSNLCCSRRNAVMVGQEGSWRRAFYRDLFGECRRTFTWS